MNISVPSRFACLKIEDDDSHPATQKKKNCNNNNKSTKNNSLKKSDLDVTAISCNSKQNPSSSKKRKTKQTDKQWEDWKKKDSEIVNDNFEQDLQNAILLSKLDYETKNTINDIIVKTETDGQNSTNVNKKKKNKTMYLDEFLSNSESKELNGDIGHKDAKENEAFFEDMLNLTKKEATKGILEEQRKERENNIENVISVAQYQEKLKFEQQRNIQLQQQLDEAKEEIASVKARNKMLCNILGQGEMKDKAEILVELERLYTVRDELTEEISRLHKLLEQERSKCSSVSQTPKHNKDKKSKKVRC